MPSLLSADYVWHATLSDATNEPQPFMGLQFSAAAVSTALSIVRVDGTEETWADGELAKGVTYPIAGLRVNETGTGSEEEITLYGSGPPNA